MKFLNSDGLRFGPTIQSSDFTDKSEKEQQYQLLTLTLKRRYVISVNPKTKVIRSST